MTSHSPDLLSVSPLNTSTVTYGNQTWITFRSSSSPSGLVIIDHITQFFSALTVVFNTLALVYLIRLPRVPLRGERLRFAQLLTVADLSVGLVSIMKNIGKYLMPFQDASLEELGNWVFASLFLETTARSVHAWGIMVLVLDTFFTILWSSRFKKSFPAGRMWIVNLCVFILCVSVALVRDGGKLIFGIGWAPLLGEAVNTIPFIAVFIVYFATYPTISRAKSRRKAANNSADFRQLPSSRVYSAPGLLAFYTEVRMFALVGVLQFAGILTTLSLDTRDLITCGPACVELVDNSEFVIHRIRDVVQQIASAVDPWIHSLRHGAVWPQWCRKSRTDSGGSGDVVDDSAVDFDS